MQRLGRDRRRARHANQDVVVGIRAQFRRERVAQQEFIAIRSLHCPLMKLPEPLVDGIQSYSSKRGGRIVMRDDRFERDQRALG